MNNEPLQLGTWNLVQRYHKCTYILCEIMLVSDSSVALKWAFSCLPFLLAWTGLHLLRSSPWIWVITFLVTCLCNPTDFSPCAIKPWEWRQHVPLNIGIHLQDCMGSQPRDHILYFTYIVELRYSSMCYSWSLPKEHFIFPSQVKR
jgi:hypothetical protein